MKLSSSSDNDTKVLTVDLTSLGKNSSVDNLSSASTDSDVTDGNLSKKENASSRKLPTPTLVSDSRDSFSTVPVEEDELDSLDGSSAPPSPDPALRLGLPPASHPDVENHLHSDALTSPTAPEASENDSWLSEAAAATPDDSLTVNKADTVSPRTIAVSSTAKPVENANTTAIIESAIATKDGSLEPQPVRKLERKRKSGRAPMTDAKRKEAADYLVSLAMHYLNLGKYQEAVVKFHQALRLYKVLHGYCHYSVAATWNSIGNAHQLLQRYEEALTSYNEALRILRILHGDLHSDVALCFHNISELYQRVGFTDVAASVRDRCMSMREELFRRAQQSSSLKAESFPHSNHNNNNNYAASVSAGSKADLPSSAPPHSRGKSVLGLGAPSATSSQTNSSKSRSFPYSNSVSRLSPPASAGTSCVIS